MTINEFKYLVESNLLDTRNKFPRGDVMRRLVILEARKLIRDDTMGLFR